MIARRVSSDIAHKKLDLLGAIGTYKNKANGVKYGWAMVGVPATQCLKIG